MNTITSANLLTLIKSEQKLLVVDSQNQFQGRVTNTCTNKWLVENPSTEESSNFDLIYGGHGCILLLHDNPPNGSYIGSWSEVFSNPELLPAGTKSVFLDNDFNTSSDWNEHCSSLPL